MMDTDTKALEADHKNEKIKEYLKWASTRRKTF